MELVLGVLALRGNDTASLTEENSLNSSERLKSLKYPQCTLGTQHPLHQPSPPPLQSPCPMKVLPLKLGTVASESRNVHISQFFAPGYHVRQPDSSLIQALEAL